VHHEQREETLYLAQAVPVPETPKPKQDPSGWKKTEVIGKRLPRVDAYDESAGQQFTLQTQSAWYALWSDSPLPYAYARVLTSNPEADEIPRSSDGDHWGHTRSHS